MSNQRQSISPVLKEQILRESDDPECVITQLASKHGITANQIYNWRNKRLSSKSPIDEKPNDFIELVPEESVTPIALEHVETELKFAEFSFSIEGKILSSKLHKIIELLSIRC